MRIPHEKRQIVAVVAIVAIIASVTSIVLTQCRGTTAGIDLRPHVAVGEVLAGETARLLNGQGKVVIVGYDVRKSPLPYFDAQLNALKNGLKKTRITVLGTELVPFNPEPTEFQAPLDAVRFNDIVSKYPDADAIVSLVGPPALADRDIRRLPQKLPLCLVYGAGGPDADLKKLFINDVVHLAIVGRFGSVDPKAPKPTTTRQWFDRYYQIVTKDNLDSLPY